MSTLLEILLLMFVILPYTFVWSVIHFYFPLKKKQIKDEVALVTGGASGIGRSLAIKLSDRGAKVVIWDINQSGCEGTCKEILARGGRFAKYYVCDVTDVDAVKCTAQRVREEVGDVTILVNNAGIYNCHNILDLTHEQIQRCININLTSHFWTVKEFLPHMLQWNHGHICAVCSVAGIFTGANTTDYSASKFGVRGFMDALEAELHSMEKHGVKLSTVYPSFVDTGIPKNLVISCRFPSLTKMISPDEAAHSIIAGIIKDERNIYIKKWPVFIAHVLKGLLPYRCVRLVVNFIGIRAESHDTGTIAHS